MHTRNELKISFGTPIDIPSRPVQSLLAYLVLNTGIAPRREKLADSAAFVK